MNGRLSTGVLPGRTGAMRSAWVLLLTACASSEYHYERDEHVDVFYQNRLHAIDVLLVVDNSCSMVSEQDHLAGSFEALIQALDEGNTAWRVGVTTSDPTMPEFRGLLAGGTDEIVIADPEGKELDRVAYDDVRWPIREDKSLERCTV